MKSHDHHKEHQMSTYDPAEPGHNPARRQALSCLATWTGAAVVWTVTGGVPRALGATSKGTPTAAAKNALIRADQRYAYRLSQGSQSRRRREPASRDRRHQRAAANACLRRAHRRCEPFVETRGIR